MKDHTKIGKHMYKESRPNIRNSDIQNHTNTRRNTQQTWNNTEKVGREHWWDTRKHRETPRHGRASSHPCFLVDSRVFYAWEYVSIIDFSQSLVAESTFWNVKYLFLKSISKVLFISYFDLFLFYLRVTCIGLRRLPLPSLRTLQNFISKSWNKTSKNNFRHDMFLKILQMSQQKNKKIPIKIKVYKPKTFAFGPLNLDDVQNGTETFQVGD